MINRHTMFEPLLTAYPEFRANHEEFMNEDEDGEEGRPNYILLGDLARECVRLLSQTDRAGLINILGVVESWPLNGDPYVRKAATVGLLENLQNENLHDGTAPSDFLALSGPESRYWWKKVDRFWRQGAPIIDDRRNGGSA